MTASDHNASDSKLIRIKTSDEKEFQVEKKVISQCNLIKGILEDLADSDEAIPLPNITGPVMEIVLQYARAHVNDDPLLHDQQQDTASSKDHYNMKRTLDIDQADADIIDVPKKTLFDIILAANYLDYTQLLDLGCKAIANDLKDKSIDQVYRDYDVPPERQFTAEERAKVEEEFAWAATANKH